MDTGRYSDFVEDTERSDEYSDTSNVKRNLVDSLSPDNSALAVYLRLRPVQSAVPSTACVQVIDSTTILAAPSSADTGNQKKFTFSEIFHTTSTQQEVFDRTALDLVGSLVNGKNVLLFAYGPTSSGKTYTMHGTSEQPGIIPRTLERLFKIIGNRASYEPCLRPEYFGSVSRLSKREVTQVLKLKADLLLREKAKESFSTFVLPDTSPDSGTSACSLPESILGDDVSFLVWLSFYEVYNEKVYDLLDMKKAHKRSCLKVGQDAEKYTYIKGLCEVPVMNAEEAYALLCVAKSNLHTAETLLNRSSSRSHSCFSIRLIQYSGEEGAEDCLASTLTLCDLAGCERSSKAGTAGTTLREAGRINNSLMVLSRCLESLRNNQNSSSENLVPFRDSKLTQIMQPYFTSGGAVAMVVNVNADMIMAEETFQALKFSAIACEVVPSISESSSRFKESYSRLTELWKKSSRHWSSIGVRVADGTEMESPEQEFGGEQVEELLETIRQLNEDYEKAKEEVTRRKLLCADYEKYIANMKNNFQALEELHDRDMEKRIQRAREAARLDVYDEAEAGSNIDLLRQLDEANEMIRRLKQNLEVGKTSVANVAGHENGITQSAQLERVKEERENMYKERLEALREEYEGKAASMASALTLKAKLLEDAYSETKCLRMQLEAREEEGEPNNATVAEKLDGLKKSLQEKDDALETLQKQFENFRKESSQKLQYLEQESASVQVLHEKDIWVLKTQLKMKDETVKSLMEELDKKRTVQVHQELLQETLDKETRDAEMKAMCTDMETKLKEKADEVERIQHEKRSLEEHLARKDAELQGLHAAVERAHDEAMVLQDEVKRSYDSRDIIQRELNDLRMKYDDLQLKQANLAASLHEAQQEKSSLETALTSTKEELSSIHERIKEQHVQHLKDQEELKRAETELEELQAKHDSLRTERSGVDEKLCALETSIGNLQGDLEEERASAKRQKEEAETLLSSITKEQQELQKKCDQLELELQCAKKSAEAQNEARAAAEDRVCQREEEINNLKAALKEHDALSHQTPDPSLNSTTEQENEDLLSKGTTRKRRTTRQSRVKSSEENEIEFKVPRRRTRATVAASMHKDDQQQPQVTPAKKSVLAEQNAGSTSPLKRLGNYLVGMLPGNSSEEDTKEVPSSAKTRRGRKALLSSDVDYYFAPESTDTTEDIFEKPVRTRSRRN